MSKPKLGELFAGIGGFGLGFERAGFETAWQVEWNEWNRAVLRTRFPNAKNYGDINAINPKELEAVDCIAGGFPCTNISQMGSCRRGGQPGLHGEASGLFFKAMGIVSALRPKWVVLENVPQLLNSNEGRDFAEVLFCLRECGYDAQWRVLNSAGFGLPQGRKRLFVVAGLGRMPNQEFIFNAAPVAQIPCTLEKGQKSRGENEFTFSTLTATNTSSRINLGTEPLVFEEGRRREMVERERGAIDSGLSRGLDDYNFAERFSAGNAVSPPVAEWIAKVILNS